MSNNSEIIRKLQSLNSAIVPCFAATVKSIDSETSCTVILPDGMEIPGVRLKAGLDDVKEFLILKPREKSSVLVGLIGDDESAGEYYIASTNEVDELVLKIKDLEFLATKDGISLLYKDTEISVNTELVQVTHKDNVLSLNANEIKVLGKTGARLKVEANGLNLKDALSAILSCIQNLKVTTPTGLGVPDPSTLTLVVQATTKINQILS